MCNFFSCIVTRNAEVLFTEEDSHEEVIDRSGLVDDLEHFVRVEYNLRDGYMIDERSIPEWYERIAIKVERNVKQIFDNVIPFREEFDKSMQFAWDEYDGVFQSQEHDESSEFPWGDYGKICLSLMDYYVSRINKLAGYVGRE